MGLEIVTRPPFIRVSHEVPKTQYLQSLDVDSRESVESFMGFVKTLRSQLPSEMQGVRFGVIAVGSTVRPEQARYHQPEDIDLRLVNSTIPGSIGRHDLGHKLESLVQEHYKTQGTEIEVLDYTPERRMVPATEYRNDGTKAEIMSPFLDYSNEDPSIIAMTKGLPLHILISGKFSYALEKHLIQERRQNLYRAILHVD